MVAQAGLRQGLAHRGQRVVPYCTRCGTALSARVALGYNDVLNASVYVNFPLLDDPTSRCSRGRRCRGRWSRTRRSPSIRRSPTCAPGSATNADTGRGARRAGARRGGRNRGAHARLGATRPALRAALPVRHRLRRARPLGAGRRLRLDRGRHRRGAHRRGVRRGRLPAGDRERAHHPQPGPAGRHLRQRTGPFAGMYVREADAPIVDALRESGRLFRAGESSTPTRTAGAAAPR